VAFGAPISLRDWLATHPADAEALGTALMQRVGEAVPVLPVPLAAAALRRGAAAVPELVSRAMALAQDLRAQGAVMELGEAPETALVGAFEVLRMRGMMDAAGQVPADQMALLAFQAGTVEQRISNSIS
jgi:glycerol-3-phosphate O-acyltransferase